MADQSGNVDFDSGRNNSVKWQWGTADIILNTSVHSEYPNSETIIADPSNESTHKTNVISEMSDVMGLVIHCYGGEQCAMKKAVLKKVCDGLTAAKEYCLSPDYGAMEKYAKGDIATEIYRNGASCRTQPQNESVDSGYSQEGFPIRMDNVVALADAKNVEGAKALQNFIVDSQNASMISEFARHANWIEGLEHAFQRI